MYIWLIFLDPVGFTTFDPDDHPCDACAVRHEKDRGGEEGEQEGVEIFATDEESTRQAEQVIDKVSNVLY